MSRPTATLKPGKHSSLDRRHPWVFTGAIARFDGRAAAGDTVEIVAHDGRWLARGAFSPESQIAVRVWTFDPDQVIDHAFFKRRLASALDARRSPDLLDSDAVRLIHSESDGLPGVTLDRYGRTGVLQITSAGAERWRDAIVDAITNAPGLELDTLFERSDVDSRSLEGLESRSVALVGEVPTEPLVIDEDGRRYRVDVQSGHKTGFYLDQRFNRTLVESVAKDRDVLDAFCYTGGFSVAARRGGAKSLTQIDASQNALTLAAENLQLNGLSAADETAADNAFGELRRLRKEERSFDLIVLDPPKFVESKAQLRRAARGYKDINLLAFQLLRPGGLLFTFSCSGRMPQDLFQKVVSDAALDAKRHARVLRQLGASDDHPVALNFPEGRYLKGLMIQAE